MKNTRQAVQSRRRGFLLKPAAGYKEVSSMVPFLLLLLPFVFQSASARTLSSRRTDVDSLLAFKASLSNQHGVLAAWNTTSDFCRWPGVGCSLKHKDRVRLLNLSSHGLTGRITPSIGNLTFLKILDLNNNNMHGEIPSSIGHLSRLQYLDLSNNSLHGDITTGLKNCTSLESIYLGSNRFTGEISPWLGGLSSLRTIHLRKNNFTGTIPPSLANLSALEEINFIENQLEGAIPEGLGKVTSLTWIQLSANHLSGVIPKTFLNLSSLFCFSVVQNELHGELPTDFGNHFPELSYLFLGENNFTGSLPASLGNATEMYALNLPTNNFAGTLPSEIGMLCPGIVILEENQLTSATAQDWEFMTFFANCTRLRILDIQKNMLGGVLPSSVGNLSAQLQVLYVGYNEISGTIPLDIGNLVGLNRLGLSRCQFVGVLPDSIGRLDSLQKLYLDHNMLSGLLPFSLGNLTRLLSLVANDNKFEGPLPASLGRFRELVVADLSGNKLTGPLHKEIFNLSISYGLNLSGNFLDGSLPPEIGALTKLAYLDLSQNNLSGSLPDELVNCQSMVAIWLNHNSFNGTIPSSIGKMRGLEFLNLTKNTLSGVIPQELGLMGGIQELYLAHNNLSGHIPKSLENMASLYQLDLSFNNLDGEVPLQGVFSNVTAFLFEGNLGLCGGISEFQLTPCPPEPKEHKMKSHFIITVATPIAGIILCLSVMLVFFTMRKKAAGRSRAARGFQLTDGTYPRVTYAELVQGTDGFATANAIGRGRYGSVYKCGLLLNNLMTTVAVKVFDLRQTDSSKSFSAECEALSKIRHRNLVSVITCCSSTDPNQNDFKALVFEFMPNGSLDRWLHVDVNASQQLQGLTMVQRLNIAVDIADALDYLHDCEPPVVHCDLKPSNILLSEHLVAHIGDFGLAKILFESATEQLINSKSSTGIRGTIGYIAPEYGEGGQVSSSGDVYSFGAVILELFTGMTPTHDMFRDGLTLQKHAENAFPGMLMQIVDPVLLSVEEATANSFKDGNNTMEHLSNAIFSVMEVALSCSKHSPTERMCMRDAAAAMRRIRDSHAKRKTKCTRQSVIAAYSARTFAETSSRPPPS